MSGQQQHACAGHPARTRRQTRATSCRHCRPLIKQAAQLPAAHSHMSSRSIRRLARPHRSTLRQRPVKTRPKPCLGRCSSTCLHSYCRSEVTLMRSHPPPRQGLAAAASAAACRPPPPARPLPAVGAAGRLHVPADPAERPGERLHQPSRCHAQHELGRGAPPSCWQRVSRCARWRLPCAPVTCAQRPLLPAEAAGGDAVCAAVAERRSAAARHAHERPCAVPPPLRLSCPNMAARRR